MFSNFLYFIFIFRLTFNKTDRYWNYVSGSLTSDSKTYAILYMNAPYAMETPRQYSFACTSTKFVLVNPDASAKGAFLKINFFIDYLQV